MALFDKFKTMLELRLLVISMRVWGAAIALSMTPGQVEAQPILLEHAFERDAQGWTIAEYSNWCPIGTFVRAVPDVTIISGGVPGNFLRVREPARGQTMFNRAPQDVINALSGATGGWLMYSRRTTLISGTFFANVQSEVQVRGGGVTLVAISQPLTRSGVWMTNAVPLDHRAWRVGSCTGPVSTPGQFASVLSNPDSLFVQSEFVNGEEFDDMDTFRVLGPSTAACSSGIEQLDVTAPTARWGHAAVVDTTRGVLVLYGGFGGDTDTWELPLAGPVARAWRRTATTGPGPKGFLTMAFDAARNKVVLAGGSHAPIVGVPENAASREVWEYTSDGTTGVWTRSVGSLPQARAGGQVMVFDSARQALVLYGGLATSVAGASDVLERGPDSDTWVVRQQTTAPVPSPGHAMVYDPVGDRTLAFLPTATTLSVWEWDAALGTWAVRTSDTAPASRTWMTATYIPSRQRILIIGGAINSSTDSAQVFEYDPATNAWASKASIPGGGRSFHAAWWDLSLNRVLVHGGLRNSLSPARDILAFDPQLNSWSTLEDYPNSPPPRMFAPAAFDEERGRMVVVGGGLTMRGANRGQLLGNGTFIFDGVNWIGGAGPTPESKVIWKAPLVYVPDQQAMFIFGGELTNSRTVSGQLWRLALTSAPTWTEVSATSAPAARAMHGAAYDRLRRRIVFFGGRNSSGTFLNDTWLLDPSTAQWSRVESADSPSPRIAPAMAFDQHRGVVVLFGGIEPGGQYDNSTWEFNGVQWRRIDPPTAGPVGRGNAMLAYAPDRRRVVLYGGEGLNLRNTPGLSDVWEFDGTIWNRLLPSVVHPIAGTAYGSAVYDTSANRVLHFAGTPITFWNSSAAPGYWFNSGQIHAIRLPRLPSVDQHPDGGSASRGGTLTLSLMTSSPSPQVFQWRLNGRAIDPSVNPSASTATLQVTNVGCDHAGIYECWVSNECGTTVSAPALVDVNRCPCNPADISDTDGLTLANGGGPDGNIDNGDFFTFFNAFFRPIDDPQRLDADIATTDGETTLEGGGPDGVVDGGDFSTFFTYFFQGCQPSPT